MVSVALPKHDMVAFGNCRAMTFHSIHVEFYMTKILVDFT